MEQRKEKDRSFMCQMEEEVQLSIEERDLETYYKIQHHVGFLSWGFIMSKKSFRNLFELRDHIN